MNNKIVLKRVLQEFSTKLPKFPDGRINYSNSDKAPVLICFVKYQDKVLLLKRSNKVRTYKGLWNSVTGYLDEFRPLEEKAKEELHEEVGITPSMIKHIKLGMPYELKDTSINKVWIIFPILVELNIKPTIKLDWEHAEHKWIYPSKLKDFDIVFGLDKTMARVL